MIFGEMQRSVVVVSDVDDGGWEHHSLPAQFVIGYVDLLVIYEPTLPLHDALQHETHHGLA